MIIGGAVVITGCSAISIGSGESDDTSGSSGTTGRIGSEAAVTAGPSILDVLPEDQVTSLADGERYLVGLAASPSELPEALRVVSVQVDDPNGDTRIGDRWYEPRLRIDDCAFQTDQAPIPFARVTYVPGDANDSTSSDPFATLEAPFSFGIEIMLFDTTLQRDAFAQVMREATFLELDCFGEGSALVPEAVEEPPIEVGYPGFGFATESPFGQGLGYQYDVGERVLLRVGANTSSDETDSQKDVDVGMLSSLVVRQIASLEAAGLG